MPYLTVGIPGHPCDGHRKPELMMIKSIFSPVLRRIVQASSLVALNSSWAGGQVKWLCMPVMNCHSCALAWFACPIGVFIHYAGYRVFPFLALGTLLLAGVLLGRFLCGWVCPMGFLQDLLYKIPGRKIALPAWTKYIKYVLLGADGGPAAVLAGRKHAVVVLPGMSGFGDAGDHSEPAGRRRGGPCRCGRSSNWRFWRRCCCWRCSTGACIAGCCVRSARGWRLFNHFSFWRVKPVAGCVGCKKCDTACPTQCGPSPRMIAGSRPAAKPNAWPATIAGTGVPC